MLLNHFRSLTFFWCLSFKGTSENVHGCSTINEDFDVEGDGEVVDIINLVVFQYIFLKIHILLINMSSYDIL